MNKKCNICLKEKPKTDFYVNKGCADGYQNRCIDCTKQKSNERLARINSDPTLKEKEKERHRKKYHRLGYKEKHKPTPEAKKKANFPEKYKAKTLSQRVIKKVKSNELHHWDYNIENAKDVIELSMKDHQKAHIYLVDDQEYYQYRRIDTMELLDTKDKHEAYIRDCIANKPD